MVAGHLQEKDGTFYAVLSYKDGSNKRKTKWIPTGLPVKGNKKKAEAFLMEQRRCLEAPEPADSRMKATSPLTSTFGDGSRLPRARLPSQPTVPTSGCFATPYVPGSRSEA